MRAELKRLQRDLGRTLVYVTHDQVEAMSMPDRVAVLREGVVQQVDTPENVYHRPVNRFVRDRVRQPADELHSVHRRRSERVAQLRHSTIRGRAQTGEGLSMQA